MVKNNFIIFYRMCKISAIDKQIFLPGNLMIAPLVLPVSTVNGATVIRCIPWSGKSSLRI